MGSSHGWKLLVRRAHWGAALLEHGIQIDNESLRHPSPVGWEHLNLTGDYTWQTTRRLAQGKFGALRPFAAAHM